MILVFILSSLSLSYAQSMSKSCSGTMRYCDDLGICTDEYFYLYAYQYVKFSNGQLKRSRHRFNFRGYVLGEEDYYQFSGVVSENHLIYTGPDFDLAIPWDEQFPIYMVKRETEEWEKICP